MIRWLFQTELLILIVVRQDLPGQHVADRLNIPQSGVDRRKAEASSVNYFDFLRGLAAGRHRQQQTNGQPTLCELHRNSSPVSLSPLAGLQRQ